MKKPSKQAGKRTAAERQALLARVRADMAATTDEEDVAVTVAATADPDNLPNRFPRRMGRPPADAPKQAVNLRLDPELGFTAAMMDMNIARDSSRETKKNVAAYGHCQ